MITLVISGGQTGADRGGLEGARNAGCRTGGTAPKGFLTENGPDRSLMSFGLNESESADYRDRTWDNASRSDGTIIFGYPDTPGCWLTAKYCRELGKPYVKISCDGLSPMQDLKK